MCTVTYLPGKDGNYILTSNRDEAPSRHGSGIRTVRVKDNELFFPEVPNNPGSWICLSNKGTTLCLLNGAHTFVSPEETFPRSRGEVLLDYFSFEDQQTFLQEYRNQGLAPYTLIILEAGSCTKYVWDGLEKEVETLDPSSPYLWSSATLYPPPVRKWREGLFKNWLAGRTSFSQEDILDFHRSGGAGDTVNGLLMNRNNLVKTLSITSIQASKKSISLLYLDLERDQSSKTNLLLPHAKVSAH